MYMTATLRRMHPKCAYRQHGILSKCLTISLEFNPRGNLTPFHQTPKFLIKLLWDLKVVIKNAKIAQRLAIICLNGAPRRVRMERIASSKFYDVNAQSAQDFVYFNTLKSDAVRSQWTMNVSEARYGAPDMSFG